jgi:hypothetical protein
MTGKLDVNGRRRHSLYGAWIPAPDEATALAECS